MSNVPTIRFKGFTDPWEQRKLGELVVIERGGSPRPIESYITDEPDGLNWVKIGDAPSMGRYITSTSERIRPEGLSKTRQVFPGDLVLSNSMSFGRPYIMAVEGCIHDGWLLIRDTSKSFDQKYLCHMLGTPAMLEQYRQLAAGSTVNNLNKELVGGAMVTIPTKDEQERIGVLLESLDNLITLHQRKYDKLAILKKSLLEKMFPKDGETEPELRFAGFTDPWEQRKLGDIFDYERPDAYIVSTEEYDDTNPTPVLTANKGFILGYTDETNVHEGECVIFDDFTLDCKYVDFPFMVKSSAMKILTPVDGVDIHFAYELLNATNIEVLGHARHYISVVQPTEVRVPCNSEQRAIGSVLSSFDNLITLHQRKLDVLKNVKTALLDKMFV